MLRRTCAIMIGILLVVSTGSGQWRSSSERLPELSLQQQPDPSSGRRSVFLAVAGSILLPGLGEYYAGNFNESGRYSLAVEGTLWLTYAGLQLHGNWVRNDARVFGSQIAGISFSGKDADFEVNAGNFLTTDEYNQAKLRNREYDAVYTDPAYSWTWASDADRERFKEERIRSDRIVQSAKFVVAGLVVNRIISAFAAGRGAAAANRAARRAEWGIGMNAGVDAGGAPSVALSFQQRW
jgi:hypothetical protein